MGCRTSLRSSPCIPGFSSIFSPSSALLVIAGIDSRRRSSVRGRAIAAGVCTSFASAVWLCVVAGRPRLRRPDPGAGRGALLSSAQASGRRIRRQPTPRPTSSPTTPGLSGSVPPGAEHGSDPSPLSGSNPFAHSRPRSRRRDLLHLHPQEAAHRGGARPLPGRGPTRSAVRARRPDADVPDAGTRPSNSISPRWCRSMRSDLSYLQNQRSGGMI